MSDGALDAAQALLRSAEELGRALHDPNPETLQAAIEDRTECFRELSERLPDSPSPELRELLQRVAAIDRRVLASARTAQEEVRCELELLARAHRAVRALRPAKQPPRFIARRV